jgi:hypothetical protein
MDKSKLLWWKLIAVWVLFLLFHFSYEAFPNLLFKIIGEEGETTFFHMKMLFFSYALTSVFEFAIRYSKLKSIDQFLYSRGFIAVAFPWLTITIWFTAEALGVHLPIVPWELLYANLITLIGIYIALRLEELLDQVHFRPSHKGIIVLLFATALLSYVSFSFQKPQHFFRTPPGFH